MKLNIKGKVALVTGGGRDIGKEISKTFAEEGAFVAINYNTSSKEAKETAQIINENGGNAKIYKADITNYEEVIKMVQNIKKDLGTIDFLINNAGYTKIQRFIESTPLDWDQQIDTSLKGAINCCHAVAPDMISNKFGKIINLVGDSSRIGEANLSATAAARGGTIALGKSLAKEFGRANITVNTVSLGLVETAHSDKSFFEKNKENIIKSYPLKRIGTPEDIAPIVVFLCSKNANWITGQVISVNGGFCMV
jgi:2-hydroxycyclohexanecarboxyl-CoA dehydrogenase|tara:strand:+ start:20939 stop:21694 length:756 start_codon:yes stop_codon:yes gene_type:complete